MAHHVENVDSHIRNAHDHYAHSPAVITRYAGPTDHQGGQVIAKHMNTGRRVTVPWDHALSVVLNHERAARHVLYAPGDTVGGPADYSCRKLLACSVNGGGYVFMVAQAQCE